MTTTTTERKPNRLIHATSPYLRQHAYNPVDWYPWGPEALEKARRENKPIFLSIGYSACHWCHVMAQESFSDEQIARIMNAGFVCIKVDREEHPDLDHIYRTSCQLFSGQGGWPLSAFLTPDLHPFYVGTYFPPQDRYGRPGFARLLKTLKAVYKEEPERVAEAAQQVMAALKAEEPYTQAAETASQVPGRENVVKAVLYLGRHIDTTHGGFGTAPKFPNTPNLHLFLHQHGTAAGKSYVENAVFALRQMIRGGIYDHLGGGFHRYSTDAQWRVPHFEKMLYDNALLPTLYLAGYQVTGEQLFAQVASETLNYVLREMHDAAGGFYATQDADSAGEEGKYYVWRCSELMDALGEADAHLFAARYGVTDKGNFAGGATVLHIAKPIAHVAAEAKITVANVSVLFEMKKC